MYRLSFTYFHAFHQYHGLSHTNAFLVVINLILELFLPRLGITKHLTKHISNKYKFNNLQVSNENQTDINGHDKDILFNNTYKYKFTKRSSFITDNTIADEYIVNNYQKTPTVEHGAIALSKETQTDVNL